MLKHLMIAFVIAFVPLTAFGYEYYESAPYFMVDGDPTVCYLDTKEKMYEPLVKQSINDWQNGLKEYTKNHDAWNIHYKFINDNFDNDFDFFSLDCTIVVFIGEYSDMSDMGYTGSTLETKSGIIQVGINLLELQSDSQILSTITHELGHAFGLGHYITNDFELLKKWDAENNAPSIMVEGTFENGIKKITKLDLQKMASLYGNDGFEKLPPNIPDWIQNIFKWYGDGLIQDQELIDAIQFLVQNGIILIY